MILSEPVVSVVMPCRNAAATLPEALDSLQDQTLSNFELLVWDDGSGDETGAILDARASRDPRMRVIGRARVGIVEAAQRLGEAATAPYIARMDADDICLPTRFERQIAFMDVKEDIGVCGCLHETFGELSGTGRDRYDGWLNALTRPDDVFRELFIECPLAHPTFLMRREAYDALGGYEDHGWPEDYDLLMRFIENGYRAAKVDEVLFKWRHHELRTSLNDPRYSPESFRKLKRHYLPRIHKDKMAVFHQWGAGEVGKKWLREWEEARPLAVVDIHPRKIGTTIHGYRIIAPEQLPPPGEGFTLVAVGAPGARDEIRGWFDSGGYREVRDYVFLA